MVYLRLSRPLVVLFSLTPLSMASYPEVSSDQCNCYLTNGSSSLYFKTHKFFDFRNKGNYAGVPDLLQDQDETTGADPTSGYFFTKEWTDNWSIQTWNNTAALSSNESDAATFMINSANNIYFEKNQDPNADSNTFLTLRTARLQDFQSSSEFESAQGNYHFVSSRMYARTIGAPGAVTAMFTYRDDSGTGDVSEVQEADLEIRTQDPLNRIQYTNQPSLTAAGADIEDATRNVTIPDSRIWTSWAVYRMDWSPDCTTWYINGNEVASIPFQTPRDPSMVIFNSWSNGGSWTGNMTVGKDAYLQIQWIEIVFNTSDSSAPAQSKDKRSLTMLPGDAETLFEKRDDASCFNVCSIDDTQKIGTPVLLQQNAGSRVLAQIEVFGAFFWVTLLSSAWTLL
ncbi:glycoside hydrolase family 16 protein [Hypoxylon sp. FL0890]|nr:glycoside hydrolase family 16 protein [Hypoxylon sp. FL0890]